jgi:hypothetical protein
VPEPNEGHYQLYDYGEQEAPDDLEKIINETWFSFSKR